MSLFKDQLVGVLGVSTVFVVILYSAGRKDVGQKVLADLRNPYFWYLSLVTISLIIWGLSRKGDPDTKLAIHHAMIALVASYFSHLSLVFPAFYIVFVAEYFSRKYIG